MYSPSILTLATAVLVSVSAADTTTYSRHHLHHSKQHDHERALQDSASCILAEKPFEECCPFADPNDGLCTALHCVDPEELTLKDECECGQLETACGQLSLYQFMYPNMRSMCREINGCCRSGTTENDDFNMCITKGIDDGSIRVPDFDSDEIVDYTNSGKQDTTTTAMTTTTTTAMTTTTTTTAMTTTTTEPTEQNDDLKESDLVAMSLPYTSTISSSASLNDEPTRMRLRH